MFQDHNSSIQQLQTEEQKELEKMAHLCAAVLKPSFIKGPYISFSQAIIS